MGSVVAQGGPRVALIGFTRETDVAKGVRKFTLTASARALATVGGTVSHIYVGGCAPGLLGRWVGSQNVPEPPVIVSVPPQTILV